MQQTMNEIQNRIRAEKLLFSDNKEYTADEVRFMSNVFLETIEKEECYTSVFFEYLSKLYHLYLRYPKENFSLEIYSIGLVIGKWLNKTIDEQYVEEQGAYCLYNHFLGLPKEENYYNFIKNRVMDVHKVKEVLDNESAYELYNNDLNFLLTNNFFLVHYPELYNINDLIQLKDIATDIDKNKFSTKEEYNNFKRAANATKTRLRRYEKNNHVKIKKI